MRSICQARAAASSKFSASRKGLVVTSPFFLLNQVLMVYGADDFDALFERGKNCSQMRQGRK